MYRISKVVRKHSTTPIVSVDEKGKETQVLFCPLKKTIGDPFMEKLVKILNNTDEIN